MDKKRYEEIMFYLTTYGDHGRVIGFFVRRRLFGKAIQFMKEKVKNHFKFVLIKNMNLAQTGKNIINLIRSFLTLYRPRYLGITDLVILVFGYTIKNYQQMQFLIHVISDACRNKKKIYRDNFYFAPRKNPMQVYYFPFKKIKSLRKLDLFTSFSPTY